MANPTHEKLINKYMENQKKIQEYKALIKPLEAENKKLTTRLQDNSIGTLVGETHILVNRPYDRTSIVKDLVIEAHPNDYQKFEKTTTVNKWTLEELTIAE